MRVEQLSQLNAAVGAVDGGDEGDVGCLPDWDAYSENTKAALHVGGPGVVGAKLDEG